MSTATTAGLTAALAFAALLTAHHLADHWIQSEGQASRKGEDSHAGQWACARHVATYTLTTLAAVMLVMALPLGADATWQGIAAGQAFSAVTHYAIDRRWTLAVLARATGKRAFHQLGRPRRLEVQALRITTEPTAGGCHHHAEETVRVPLDNPVLGTGAYSLDQSLHIAALFVSALLTALI